MKSSIEKKARKLFEIDKTIGLYDDDFQWNDLTPESRAMYKNMAENPPENERLQKPVKV